MGYGKTAFGIRLDSDPRSFNDYCRSGKGLTVAFRENRSPNPGLGRAQHSEQEC
jgi:hypothetical protein